MQRNAFTLIELVIVVAVVGIIAAIAAPRLASAGQGAKSAALARNLQTLRNAIDRYQVEHLGNFPDDQFINEQLTEYSAADGNFNATPTPATPLGPYLTAIPPLPVGPNAGNALISSTDQPGVGWIYNQTNGHIRANANGNDPDGTPWADY